MIPLRPATPPCSSGFGRDGQIDRAHVPSGIKTAGDPKAKPADHARVPESRLKPLLQAAVLVTFAIPALADYQAGLDAHAAHDYATAMGEWRAVTDGPPTAASPRVFAEAHYAIAQLYWQGQGVPRDWFKAREWLEKAAGYGHAGAMGKLGYLYAEGITVPQDYAKAFELYDRAAKRGDVDALYNLGIFYLNGWGTAPDEVMARQYLAAASAQGDPAAEEALQQLLARAGVPTPTASAGAASAAISPPQNPATGARPSASGASINPGGESRLKPLLPEDDAPGQDTPIHRETWILAQNPAHYTIQAIALRDRDKLEALIEGRDELAPWAIYVTQRNATPLHVLVQGVYADVDAARAARNRFPRAVNRPDRVWIRQFGKVQEAIRAEEGDGASFNPGMPATGAGAASAATVTSILATGPTGAAP